MPKFKNHLSDNLRNLLANKEARETFYKNSVTDKDTFSVRVKDTEYTVQHKPI